MNAIATAAPSSTSALVHPSIHPDERAAREQLAACYRVFAMLGWTEMIYNHITVRLPDSVTGGEKQFLINPFGLHYSELLENLDRVAHRLPIGVRAHHYTDLNGFVHGFNFTFHPQLVPMIDITLENFQAELIEASVATPVLLDIWAEWCGPCKQLGPMLEKLEVEYGGRFTLAKLDADKVLETARRRLDANGPFTPRPASSSSSPSSSSSS